MTAPDDRLRAHCIHGVEECPDLACSLCVIDSLRAQLAAEREKAERMESFVRFCAAFSDEPDDELFEGIALWDSSDVYKFVSMAMTKARSLLNHTETDHG